MRSNTRIRRGYISARVKPAALFVAIALFASALALTGSLFRDIPAARAASTTILINEVDGDTPTTGTDTANEWFELRNISASNITLTGWTITDNNATDTIPTVTLGPGGHVIVAGTAAGFAAEHASFGGTVLAMGDGSIGNGLANGGDVLTLKDNNGATIDCISWGTNTSCLNPAPPTDSSSNTNQRTSTTDTDAAADWTRAAETPNGNTNVLPNLTINDVSQAETNAGTTTFTFTVSISAPAGPGGVTFDIATADGTAQDDNPTTEDNDYVARSLTGQTIPAGSSTYTFDVTVNGDTAVEPSETFFVNVTSVTGASVADGQGQGTIQNDDSSDISINDVSQDEGSGGGTTAYTFTVTLSKEGTPPVTVDYATANGTTNPATGGADCNTAGVDYISTSGTLTFDADDTPTSEQITVQVCADAAQEPNETFFVNLSNQSANATIADAQGVGTIANDDFTITPIHEIQGSTPSGNAPSPKVNEVHTTTGIVTLLKNREAQGSGTANGFFLQTPGDDGDPNTSQGLFVFTSSVPTYTSGGSPVAVGDEVRVTGTVVEFNGLTEIGSVTNISSIDTGNPLPTAVTLTTTILAPDADPAQPQLEKYEGMRLKAPSLRTVAPNDNFYDVETVLSTVARPLREPGIPKTAPTPPDPSQPDCCVPVWDENPERLKVDTNGRTGTALAAYTSNVTLLTNDNPQHPEGVGIFGPLDYGFGEYRLIPEAAIIATPNMIAAPVPTPFATEFTVAGFNIENFNSATAAGATQQQKAALAIVRILRLPDIIGVAEILNLSSLQALAAEVNTRAVADGHPNPQYEARLIPTPVGGITQNVGFLVKTSRVRIDAVTQERATDKYTQPSNGQLDDTHDRPPLVLRATVEPNGANKPVIIMVNHTRSFNEVEDSTGGGANARAKRKAQAESLAGLFQELQTNNPNVPVIGVGDYNAFEFNSGYDDPISVIKGDPTNEEQIVVGQSPDLVNPNLSNLIEKVAAAERYTFIFEGTPQVLDHVLANTVAGSINTRITIAHMNSDFPDAPASAYRGNAAIPERNSDHDAPVAYFTLFAGAQPGQLLINEFRHFGPTSAEDEFIEIYNNTEVEHVVAATDGSGGYSIATASDQTAGTPRCVIPNGTRIPSRGYFLCVNSDGYSLAAYPSGTNPRNSAGDATYTLDLPVNAGIALFSTASTANYSTDTRLDAAGSVSETNTLYKETTGYPDISGTARQYSFFRDLRAGRPKDSNDNSADFVYVNTDGANEGAGGQLGAPGPQNLSSPTQLNQLIKASLIDPCAGLGAGANQERDQEAPGGEHGTLTLRRTFTNKTQTAVTRLRFRVVDITTLNSPGYAPGNSQADLRVLSSTNTTLTVTGANCQGTQQIPMAPLTLEDNPPAQPLGGGLHSTLAAGTITLDDPLGAGQSRNFEFVLGVQQRGVFRFFVNVEVEPESQMTEASPAKAGERRTKR